MKVKIFLTLLIITLSVVSCKDALDEVPYSSLSSQTVFANEDGLKKATYGIYQSWTALNWFDVFYRFILSETGHQYATAGMLDAAFFDPFYRFAHSPNEGGLDLVWNRYYQVVSRANTVIANADKAVSDPKVADAYKAEAKFLRAYAYFNLVRNFGGVPIIDQEINSLAQEDLIFGGRKTTEETYNFIVEDLKFAEANLPDLRTGADVGRVTAGVAKAMLGKVYLHMAGKPLEKTEYFKLAADKLKEVVDGNEAKYNFGLMSEFPDVFALENERSREILLSFSYYQNSANPHGNIYPFFLWPTGFLGDDEQTRFGLTYKFYQLFEPTDTRRDFTVIQRYEFSGTPGANAQHGDMISYNAVQKMYINERTGNKFGTTTVTPGLAYGKFARASRPKGSLPWAYSNDLIELRFSDVLLCLAEALTEDGKPAEALPYLNRVRQRAHASPSVASGQSAMRDAVRLERRLELTGEFTTVYDIRRWGTLQQEIAAMIPEQIIDGALGTYSPKLEIYPIPQAQINANPNLEQNDGWK